MYLKEQLGKEHVLCSLCEMGENVTIYIHIYVCLSVFILPDELFRWGIYELESGSILRSLCYLLYQFFCFDFVRFPAFFLLTSSEFVGWSISS